MSWLFNYIAITNNISDAIILNNCGIQQVMIDTENIGKKDRQAGKNTVINFHEIDDIRRLKILNLKMKIICRINGYHSNIESEIESAISAGADCLMLPMIQNLSNLSEMVFFIKERVEIIPLIETPYSMFKLNEIIKLTKPKQIHFGLNDLHFSLGMKNLFEILVSPLFASAVAFAKEKVPLVGIGGIGDPNLKQKVSPNLLINIYKTLGSQSVILSRNFFQEGYNTSRILDSLYSLEKLIIIPQDGNVFNELIKQLDDF